jgi:hypothetical protein
VYNCAYFAIGKYPGIETFHPDIVALDLGSGLQTSDCPDHHGMGKGFAVPDYNNPSLVNLTYFVKILRRWLVYSLRVLSPEQGVGKHFINHFWMFMSEFMF